MFKSIKIKVVYTMRGYFKNKMVVVFEKYNFRKKMYVMLYNFGKLLISILLNVFLFVV
jgi:hypothetical protein